MRLFRLLLSSVTGVVMLGPFASPASAQMGEPDLISPDIVAPELINPVKTAAAIIGPEITAPIISAPRVTIIGPEILGPSRVLVCDKACFYVVVAPELISPEVTP